ncbi:hypothetical protein HMPREF0044_1396 [Gleimia coleocanis DSM 15436]|uniref:3'-phosphate/5'-hydroxy nucleic acid ligase n=1 Tax=Gleimia coleocanis DSM 15436 TaxID=525245 RepID=C0W1V6_9ACTO|nr:RtcB family protein [Gleimia coleocanis]EEH63472.1 hypothetical protein HMPREF0044_1396 [Gleimia coleocanis DSM 15436]
MSSNEKPLFPVPLHGTKANTLIWTDPYTIDIETAAQIRMMSRVPWVEQIRIMPDVHWGNGATVGSVIAMKDAVAPAAVGVDIGCGMAAVNTGLRLESLPDDLHSLRLAFEEVVPVGRAGHKKAAPILKQDQQLSNLATETFRDFSRLHADLPFGQLKTMRAQCGSLGGGNHFIELCSDDHGEIWLMLHSGSRNIGKVLAEYHMHKAAKLEHNLTLEDRSMSVFISGTGEMDAYLHDLYWAQDYARLNRAIMLATLKNALLKVLPQANFGQEIQCHHNYVAQETHGGVDVIVTRKGAIRAGSGDLGLIPGSMGTGSFIVRGLGNEASLCSASHGAGRRMSRSEARRIYSASDLAAQTAGVECRKDAGIVDEIPAAYKDLDEVIAAQTQEHSPLVEVVARLTTLLCVKG